MKVSNITKLTRVITDDGKAEFHYNGSTRRLVGRVYFTAGEFYAIAVMINRKYDLEMFTAVRKDGAIIDEWHATKAQAEEAVKDAAAKGTIITQADIKIKQAADRDHTVEYRVFRASDRRGSAHACKKDAYGEFSVRGIFVKGKWSAIYDHSTSPWWTLAITVNGKEYCGTGSMKRHATRELAAALTEDAATVISDVDTVYFGHSSGKIGEVIKREDGKYDAVTIYRGKRIDCGIFEDDSEARVAVARKAQHLRYETRLSNHNARAQNNARIHNSEAARLVRAVNGEAV